MTPAASLAAQSVVKQMEKLVEGAARSDSRVWEQFEVAAHTCGAFRAPPHALIQHWDSLSPSLSLFPEKQPAFFSQRELRALCACSAAAFRFRSPCRVFTKGSRNSINLRGRAAEFGSVQPLSSASGIRCHLTKAASNYIFLSRLLYPRWFLSSLAVCPVCDQRRCQMKCKVCASQF